jgi:beta-glucosidase
MTTAATRSIIRRHRATSATVAACVGAALALTGCTSDPAEDDTGGFTTREVTDGRTTFVVVENPDGGPTLSYGPDSGVTLLTEQVDGVEHAFKDMNANGTLDVWEDWREDARTRAGALAQELSIEQIAGLMLFSSHERSPVDGLTDAQQEYLSDAHLRNVLNAGPNDVEANVTWSNAMQAYVEGLATEDEPYVPVNFSSDPRTAAQLGGAYNAAGADISRWPEHLGLAATFEVDTVAAFSTMVSAEYRALGVTTALSPQIDPCDRVALAVGQRRSARTSTSTRRWRLPTSRASRAPRAPTAGARSPSTR